MAKKKTAKETAKPKLKKLTDDQIKQLAGKLINTSKNIFTEVHFMFGEEAEVNDKVFDRMEKVCDIFKCDECDVWQSTDWKDKFCESTCEDCVADREEDDEDEDDEDEEEDEDE